MRKDSASWLWGVIFLTSTAAISAQTFKVIRHFGYSSPPPLGRLLCSSNTLYGAGGGGAYGYGSVFRVKTDGIDYRTLKSFTQTYANTNGLYTNSDGAGPLAA